MVVFMSRNQCGLIGFNMTTKQKLTVFIGRFSPFHIGHMEVIFEALKVSDHLLVLVGSCGQPRSIKNPWTFEERKLMIEGSLSLDQMSRVSILPSYDKLKDNDWIDGITNTVEEFCWKKDPTTEIEIKLIGHTKDQSSYYLKMFPHYDQPIEVPLHYDIDATSIRRTLFLNTNEVQIEDVVSTFTNRFLSTFMTTNVDATWLLLEYASVQPDPNEPKPKYPRIDVTVDAVVVHQNKVLLVRRGKFPGKGLWALPGGFLESHERIADGIIRELLEETQIGVSNTTLRTYMSDPVVFDNPTRSARGRLITHAAMIDLTDAYVSPPCVLGADDADKAAWVCISDVQENVMFDDHYAIISQLLAHNDTID